MNTKSYWPNLLTLITLLMLLPIFLNHEAFIMIYSLLIFSNADKPLLLTASILIMGGYSIYVAIITLRVWSIILEKKYTRALVLLAIPFFMNWTVFFLGKFYWKIG